MSDVIFIGNNTRSTTDLTKATTIIFSKHCTKNNYLEILTQHIKTVSNGTHVIFNGCYPSKEDALKDKTKESKPKVTCLGVTEEKSWCLDDIFGKKSKIISDSEVLEFLKLCKYADIVVYTNNSDLFDTKYPTKPEISESLATKDFAIMMLFYAEIYDKKIKENTTDQEKYKENKLKCLEVANLILCKINKQDTTDSRFSSLENYDKYKNSLIDLLENESLKQDPELLDSFYASYPSLSLYVDKIDFIKKYEECGKNKEIFESILNGDIFTAFKDNPTTLVVANCLELSRKIGNEKSFLKHTIMICEKNETLKDILNNSDPLNDDIIGDLLIMLCQNTSSKHSDKISTALEVLTSKMKNPKDVFGILRLAIASEKFAKNKEIVDNFYDSRKYHYSRIDYRFSETKQKIETCLSSILECFSHMSSSIPSCSPFACCAKPAVDPEKEVRFGQAI